MTALYIHLPFCKQKCNYCDFVSYAGKKNLIDEYVEALCEEIGGLGNRDSGIGTIFFGGGTPTLLETKHFEKILTTLSPWEREDGSRQRVRASEISIESNPGTADLSKLKTLRTLGLNRLSIGVQSFNDKYLKTLGRIHTAEEAIRFYDNARAAGFDNINLDLMFALPDQTLDDWKKDLHTALDLKPNHLSTYNLQIEEGTPFWEMTKSQAPNPKQAHKFHHPTSKLASSPSPNIQLPSEETELSMYEYTIGTLTAAGYHHYEISNFARPGFECRHNINYWRNGNYIGVGAGAHSHVNGQRWANPSCIEKYLETAALVPISTSGFSRRFPASTPDQRETIFLGLRLLAGLPKGKFTGFEKEVRELLQDGLLEEQNRNYKLTRRGLYLGNLVFEKFV